MRVSLFKIGVAFVVGGGLWISVIFAGADSTSHEGVLRPSASFEIRSDFAGGGIGFYTVHMPGFAGERMFVQILDKDRNIVGEEIVGTRMSVGYFDHGERGAYTMRVTNVSAEPAGILAEFGETRSQEMVPAGVLVLAGSVAVMAVSYMKIRTITRRSPMRISHRRECTVWCGRRQAPG